MTRIAYFKKISGFFFCIAVGAIGCSDQTLTDPWEAVKLAYKLKKRGDLQTNLQLLPAAVYSAKLLSECKSDAKKCIEAMHVLRFALIATEGEEGSNAQVACHLEKIFALDYLIQVHLELQRKLIDASTVEAEIIQARLADVEGIQDSYIKSCSNSK